MEEKKVSRRQFTRLIGGAVVVGALTTEGLVGCDPAPGAEPTTEPAARTEPAPSAEPAPQKEPSLEAFGAEPTSAEPKAEPPVGGEPSPRPEPPQTEPPAKTEPPVKQELAMEPAAPDVEPIPEVRPEPPLPEVPPVDFGKRKYVTVDLKKYPHLKQIDGFELITLPNNDAAYIFRRSAVGFFALSSSCTHRGCTVGWRPPQRRFVCPCHAATFNFQGYVTGGPAPKDLPTYQTGFDPTKDEAYIFYS